MIVKICGVRDRETAIAVADSGADWIGFVFAESSRQVSPEQVREITASLPESIQKVGVFVNESPDEINRIAAFAGLDIIQLHGDESPADCEQIRYPIIKAFPIREASDLSRIEHYAVDYYLVDRPGDQYRGGSGVALDWKLLKNARQLKNRIILAGGLHTENVQEAIQTVGPLGVDVSSGVETDGMKDKIKIQSFIERAKISKKEMRV